MIAALNGHTQTIETLVEHGAIVNAKDKVLFLLYIVI